MDLLISNIANWYARKDVLLTGASGFMGKAILEKLLRSCPNIRNIFLIIRPKKDVSSQERAQKLIENPLFDVVRKKNPVVFDKIIIIEGDMSEPFLGISDEDAEMLMKNVAMVIHSAATVKFEEPLKYGVAMNVVGTKFLLDLCTRMKRLESFVYVSSAYSNCNRYEIEEKVYPLSMDFDEFMRELKKSDEANLMDLKKRIIDGRPNLYSATKALAEYVVSQYDGKIPVAIVRPSIVGGTLLEPVEGWVDNLNGPAGIFLSIGKGILRSLMLYVKCTADIVPLDLSVNMILAAGWSLTQFKKKQLMVYNCTSGGINPITWGHILGLNEKYFIKNPLKSVLWYPHAFLQSSKYYHKICVVFLHVFVAHLLDFILNLLGQKPRMVKIQRQINAAINAMEFFTTHSFNFHTENVEKLQGMLSDIDKRIFNFDMGIIDWEQYTENYCLGMRKYILNDDIQTIPEARKKIQKLKYIHYGVQMVVVIFLIFLVLSFMQILYNVIF